MHDYVDTISSSQWATETVLGSSEQGRDIDLLTITNTSIPIANKKIIYIIGRQHSAETASSHMLKGMIDFLISSDTDAKRMRDNFVWYIVPMVNPDGVYLGKSRATSENRDPNRDWHPDNHNSNYSIDFFIDWHNQMNDDRWYNFIYSPTGNTFFSILSDWTDFDSQSASGASGCTDSYCTARGYIMNNILFDPTFVFEPTPHLYTWTIGSLKQEGEYVAFAIDEYFDEPPEIDNVQATPPSVSQDGYVNITCDVADNDVVDTVKVNISGPGGFTPVNATMNEGSYYYNTTYTVVGTYNFFIWANDTSGNSNMSTGHSFSITSGILLVDSEFNDSTDSADLRANSTSQDWYESRNDDPTLLTLNTSDVGGNSGKKAALKNYGIAKNAYLAQELSNPQTGTFNVSLDIFIDRIQDSSNYDRTAYIWIGDDTGTNNPGRPCSTSNERFVYLTFYDSTPGDTLGLLLQCGLL